MPLPFSVYVLKVWVDDGRTSRNRIQAVEVTRPSATYELVIKTAMGKGTTIPKGRISWPRQAKSKTQDKILVFAEGRQADEAKRAGADIVGGPELIDGVGSISRPPHSTNKH